MHVSLLHPVMMTGRHWNPLEARRRGRGAPSVPASATVPVSVSVSSSSSVSLTVREHVRCCEEALTQAEGAPQVAGQVARGLLGLAMPVPPEEDEGPQC